MTERVVLSWAAVERRVEEVVRDVRDREIRAVYGIPRGGLVPAAMIATALDVPLCSRVDLAPTVLVVDDLVDSGATFDRLDHVPRMVAALYSKSWSPARWAAFAEPVPGDAWLVFPWELEDPEPGVDEVLRLLQTVGVDTAHPAVIRAAAEVTSTVARFAAGQVDLAMPVSDRP